jgi:hypothetical protein
MRLQWIWLRLDRSDGEVASIIWISALFVLL